MTERHHTKPTGPWSVKMPFPVPEKYSRLPLRLSQRRSRRCRAAARDSGPKTLMNWPTSIAVHPDRGELFIANDTADTVTVYRTDANGDVAPIRVLKGPRSMIKNPTGVALDLRTMNCGGQFRSHSATVFPVDASGDPIPKRVIRSGRADEASPCLATPHVAYDTKRDQLLVSN